MSASTSLEEDLKTLLTAINNLPPSSQSGRRDDPLGKYLTPGLTKGDDPKPVFPSHTDGAYVAFNREWERVFQKRPGDPDDKLQKLVSHGRGKHGLILAHATGVIDSTVNKDLDSAEEGENDSADDDADKSKKRKKPTTAKGKPNKKAKKAAAESGDEEPAKPKQKAKTAPAKTSKGAKDKSPEEDSDSSSSSEEDMAEQSASVKLTWALTQYRKPKNIMNGPNPMWKFDCRYCTKFRSSPRTDGIDAWAQETVKIKGSSNFIKHAEECDRRPPAQSWEQYQLARERKRQGLPALPVSSDPSPHEAERDMMSDFIRRGVENPAKAVTNGSYRRHLVEAIVEDDLAFSVAEKGGMLRLLNHLVPRGVNARVSHQTVRRNLDDLYKALQTKLRDMLKVLSVSSLNI
ncbi:hypothetical protein C8R44DRAFT_874357 [Mycena epipterygia]|nr:hypothetical protein C8R44DRAFT_874357 [Mycena epipterygia]